MPYVPGQLSRTSSTQTGPYVPGSLSRSKTTEKKSSNYPISTLEDLKATATKFNVEVKEKKPSLFQRTVDVISRPLYASAGAAKALVKKFDDNPFNDESVLGEAWKGLSGKEKETYSDVLKETGVENKYVRGVVGFALDVALDPTTYFGGTFIKGAGKVAKPFAKAGLETARKINPVAVQGLEMVGKGLKDALGNAFKFGYGTTAGLSDDVARTLNKLGIAKEEVIEGNIKIFGKQFSKNELQEAGEIMIKNRRLELQARKGVDINYVKSSDPKVNQAVEIMKTKAKELAEKAGLDPETAYENYIPFLRTDKIGKGVEQSTAALKVGREGYLKEFKDLVPDEKLLRKPIESYSRREYEVVRDNIVKKTLNDLVETYGKPLTAFKNADEATKADYRLLKDKTFGKEVGYLKEQDYKFINDFLFPEFKTIDLLARSSGFDFLTRWFKQSVTSWFPAFHIRNYISGNVQNYSVIGNEAFNPKNHNTALGVMKNLFGKGTDNIVELGGKRYSTKELAKELQENFGGASRYISDIGDYIDELSSKNFKLRKIKDPGRKLGNFIEMNQKAVAVVGSLRQGKTLKEAIKLAEQAGFDYSKITKFESRIMRRLIPFYTFARKNAGLQARTAVKNPERILNQIKFTKNLSEVFGGGKPTEEDLKGLPDWALNGLGFKVEGNRFLTEFGLPVEEFVERVNDPFKTTTSSLNPIIKFPIEGELGYDFFREQKLIDINKVAPATGELLLNEKTPQVFKDFMEIRKVETDYGTKYYGSPKSLHALRNLPTSRLQNTLEKLFEEDKASVDKWLAFLTGARIYDIDLELQQYFRERDLYRDLQDQLLNKGIAVPFEKGNIEGFFVPKEQG